MRDCLRCGFTLPLELFPARQGGRRHICGDCLAANPFVWRVAAIAADGILRLRAIDALLYLGYVRAARVIASGATVWPSILDLREGTLMPRQPLWWISLDADTIALLRMMVEKPGTPRRTPILIPAA